MHQEVIKLLICPNCRADFEKKDNGFRCTACGISFPVVDEVPMMVQETAEDKSSTTAERFGYEWQTFAENYEQYKDQFLDWISPVTSDFFRDKLVLDAGCGKGKHAVLAERFGARGVVAIDYGKGSIESARTYIAGNALHPENIQLLRADIRLLPFKFGTFDYIYSVGVLHHLPDPKEGFLKLVSLVKPGGSMSVWVYGREGTGLVRHTVEFIRRYVTSKMPVRILLPLSWCFALPAFGIAKFIYRPISYIAPRFYRIFPMSAYITMWFDLPFKEIWNIVFDQLVTPITHYISRDDITDWLEAAGVSKHQVTQRMGLSWRIFLTV